jgi:hypothetical protein
MIEWVNEISLDEETYPFICNECKGFYDCNVAINGKCVCPECEKEIYNRLKHE